MIVSTFIVQASFTIVTYDCQNMFIIQATGYFVDNVNCHNSFNILFSGITGDKMPPKKQEGKEKKPKPEAKTFSEGDLVPYLIKLFFSSSLPED